MTTTARASNLRKPWAWLAALAALCLVLASSTALYVLNPSVKLTLPWWTAIAAPAAIYALILPLCVPGLRIGGWLAGFGILSLLHLALGATTAWLYSAVTFLPVQHLVASAFWSFPPALVLDMVGSLVMTLPFLDTLAPRPADPALFPTGSPGQYVNFSPALAPCARAVNSATCRIRCSNRSVTASSNVRTVPPTVATSGITLVASPAWIIVTDSTAESIGFLARVTIACSP